VFDNGHLSRKIILIPCAFKIFLMRKLLFYCTSTAFILLLWGCPYQSLVPLGQPLEKINERIIGSWVSQHEVDKESPSYYVINTSDSIFYMIDHFTFNDNDSSYSVKQYVAHSTTLDSNLFLNVQGVGNKDYIMHRIELMKEGFVLYEVTDNVDEKFTNSEEMQTFFKKNMHLSFFYNREETVLVRKKE